MASFVSVGPYTINLDYVAAVHHSKDSTTMHVKVFFSNDGIPLELEGEEARLLSQILSAHEARSERDLADEAGFSLYSVDSDDEDALLSCAACVLSGPPDDAA